MKNVLAALVNAVAAVVFVFFADGRVAAGAPARRRLGGRRAARREVGRRLSPAVLRGVIVVVGVAAIVQLLT